MNYRHAFHAGNFADVMKHTALTLVLEHLQKKETPFFVLDTHAGRGSYDLQSLESAKTEEAAAGIGRLWALQALPPPLENYLQIVRRLNGDGRLRIYPGSPHLICEFLRLQDRALFYEKHPEDCAALRKLMNRKKQVRVLDKDGWQALKSKLPPRERRGLVLVDPPYEQENETSQLLKGLQEAVQRFATGIYLAWYPVKGTTLSQRLEKRLRAWKGTDIVQIELLLRKPNHPKRLDGSGLIVINPPWQFEQKIKQALEPLGELFAAGPGGCVTVNRLA